MTLFRAGSPVFQRRVVIRHRNGAWAGASWRISDPPVDGADMWRIPAGLIVSACLVMVSSSARAHHPTEISGEDIAPLVADLADDDVRWNALSALRLLSAFGDDAVPELELALDSPDWQQRQLAAVALRRIEDYLPSSRMLEVTVEGLRHDGMPWGRADASTGTGNTMIYNANRGTRYLLDHGRRAESALIEGLRGDDHQQQFLCAYILGCTGRTAALEDAAPILIEHLRDNDIRGDAIMAAIALFQFGDDVLPYIAFALRNADEQQQRLTWLIMLDLDRPPQNRRELERRKDLHDITDRHFDPLIQHNPKDIDLRWGDRMWRHGRPVTDR